MIDCDLRGNMRVIRSNISSRRVEFNIGRRIAQVVFQKKENPDFVVSSFDDFPTKGEPDGFGSTGI